MQLFFFVFSIIMLALTFWLGLYLLRRDAADPRLRWTGIGLLLYAALLATLVIQVGHWSSIADGWPPQFWWLLSLPAVAWTGAAVHLLPEGPLRTHMHRFWLYGEVPLTVLLVPLFVVAGSTGDTSVVAWLYLLLAVVVLPPMIVIVAVTARQAWRMQPRFFSGLLWVAALFFTLSMMAVLLPLFRIDPVWLVLAIGGDLLLLGLAIGGLDVFDQGETFLPDLLLSLDGAALYALLFGGLVSATMLLSTGATPAMRMLLLLTMAAAISVQVFSSTIQSGVDRVALAASPDAREDRAELRIEGDELPRQDPASTINGKENEAFARLTRRALSQMDDLTKLANSPLTQMPLLDQRLASSDPDRVGNQTARTRELKIVLTEAIAQMKPTGDQAFGTTGQWRFYNALYYPYVVGLRPYSRRADHAHLDEKSQQALAWFRTQVPERTLYNWQKIGAQWVARYLRDLEPAG